MITTRQKLDDISERNHAIEVLEIALRHFQKTGLDEDQVIYWTAEVERLKKHIQTFDYDAQATLRKHTASFFK